MIKRCKKFFEWKAIHDFDAFFNVESIRCFFPISYIFPEIIKKKEKHEKNSFTKSLIFN